MELDRSLFSDDEMKDLVDLEPEFDKFKAKCVKLFGSRVLGKGRGGRDIDLHVEVVSSAQEYDMKFLERPHRGTVSGTQIDITTSIYPLENDPRIQNKDNISKAKTIWRR